MRIKNGITMDSGSSVFVTPSGWLTMFLLEEPEGSRRGQTHTAAAKNDKPFRSEGQRKLKFHTVDNEMRKVAWQVAAVNNIPASVAGVCDNGYEVIFRKHVGDIINLATGKKTPFRRDGNIYAMGAWFPNPECVGE